MFSGRYHCSQVGVREEDEQQKGKINAPSEAGVGLYLGELRDMMRRLLQDEDIHNIIRYQTYEVLLLQAKSQIEGVLTRFRQYKLNKMITCALFNLPGNQDAMLKIKPLYPQILLNNIFFNLCDIKQISSYQK